MMPFGHVMYELNQRMKNGLVPGLSNISQVYSDNEHLNATGAYIVATTFFTTQYRRDPRGMIVPSDYGTINATVAAQIQDAAWSVVRSLSTYTGVY
jgi:hypothetical protein